MFMRHLITYSLILLAGMCSFAAKAQEQWTLRRCIDHALEHNIQIMQGELSAKLSRQDVIQSKAAALPTLNGFATHSYNFGQTIDRYTNQFAQDRVRSNNFSLNSSVTLFNGFQTVNTIKQNRFNEKASSYDVDKIRNDISLNVAGSYLQVLFSEEQLEIARNQLDITLQQLDRTEKLVRAGSLAKGSLLDIEAQLATEELNLVTAENQLDIAYLNLRQLLELDINEPFRIVKPDISLPGEIKVNTTPGQVYEAAISSLPEIKSAEYRKLSSERMLAIAKGGRSPQLNLNATYGTGYSGARQDIADVIVSGYDTIAVTTSGESVISPSFTYEYETASFNEQIGDNLNQTIGLNLTIPIFNGWAVKTSIAKAKIGLERAQLDIELTKNTIRKNIQQAYTDAVAATKKHRATQKSVNALKESFHYAEQRFNVGMVTAVEYNDAKNKLTKAQSDLLQAKYDYVFKTKILDFYQGKSLGFK